MPLDGIFRREERLEHDPVQIGIDAGAGVVDGDARVAAGRQARRRLRRVEGHDVAEHVDRAVGGEASRALITRFITTCSICPGSTRAIGGGPGVWIRSVISPAIRCSMLSNPRSTRVNVDHFRFDRLAPAEDEQLPRQRRAPLSGLGDLAHIDHQLMVWCETKHDEIGAAENGGQHVVEIVSDAAREAADRLHLLDCRSCSSSARFWVMSSAMPSSDLPSSPSSANSTSRAVTAR